MVAPPLNRKPHLLRVKKSIVALLDKEIAALIALQKVAEPESKETYRDDMRDLAIWIRQRNKLAKDAEIEPMPLNEKDGQGNFIYKVS